MRRLSFQATVLLIQSLRIAVPPLILIVYFGDIEISVLTIHDVRRWRAHYASFQKPDTIRWRLSCLRSVLKLMRRKGESVIDYEDIIIPDKEKKLDRDRKSVV